MVQYFKLNTKLYINLFSQLASELMPKRNKPANPEDVF